MQQTWEGGWPVLAHMNGRRGRRILSVGNQACSIGRGMIRRGTCALIVLSRAKSAHQMQTVCIIGQLAWTLDCVPWLQARWSNNLL